MKSRSIAYLVVAFFIIGCAPIQTYERLHPSPGPGLSTYVGGAVFKMERTSDLPNVAGKADIFGGKVNRGFTELRYQGLTQDGKLVFRVTEIETQSNETAMSRYGRGVSSVNLNTSYSAYGSQTYGTAFYQPPPQGRTEILPPNTTEFIIDPSKTKELNIAGVRVEIRGFDAQSLRYSLNR